MSEGQSSSPAGTELLVKLEEALFEIRIPTPDRDHAGCWGVGRNSFLSSRCVGRYTTKTIKSQLITT